MPRTLSQSFLHVIFSFHVWIMGRAQPLKLIATQGAEFLPEAPGPGLECLLSCSLTPPPAEQSKARLSPKDPFAWLQEAEAREGK